jgi:hypothetical protein
MNKVTKVLGWAFLIQAVSSLISGAVLETKWYVEGDMHATLLNIASQPGLFKTNIFVDIITAMGIIFLGAALYAYLRKTGEKMALTGFAFYILEGILIAASRINAFSLLGISREYAAGGQSAALLTLGTLAYDGSHFGGMTLSMLAFCAGAFPLYYLLFKSRIIPSWLSLIGLATLVPCTIGSLLSFFNGDAPMGWFVAYIPFEFVTGLWIVIRGVKVPQLRALEPAASIQG